MPLPRWLAQINKRVFNRFEIKRGKRPVITHVGRASGSTYRTPLDAHQVEGGYLFLPLYGPRSDWVKNVLAAGSAHLKVGADEYDLVAPRLIPRDEAEALLPEGVKMPPDRIKVSEFLRMDFRAES